MAAPIWQAGTLYIPGDLVQPITAPKPNVPQVTNGDFAGGATGWTFTGGAEYVTTGGYNGGACVRLPGNVAEGLARNNTQLYVQPGGSLTASAMIQQGASVKGATTGWVEVLWYDGLDTLISEEQGNKVDDGSGGAWRQSTVTSVRPPGASYARAAIHLTSVADHSHPIWGDSLTVSGASAGLPEGLVYRAVQPEAGSSGSSEPAWPSILGQQVTDNDVIWEAVTTSRVTWTASPRYVSGQTEPAWPTDMGAMVQDGTINWKAVPRRVEDEKCPNTKVVAILASKVFAADKDIVRFSATANPLDWSSANNAGYLPTGLQQANSNDVAVLAPYRGNLAPMNASSFQNWQVDPDPASMALLDQMDGIGSVWPKAAVPVANDLFYLSQLGVRTIGIANAAENLAAGDVGAPIDVLVRQAMLYADRTDKPPLATYYPGAGQYWLAFPNYPPPALGVFGRVPAAGCGDLVDYSYVVAGGLPPYRVEVVDGALPVGLVMDLAGRVTGEIVSGGDAVWTVQATDSLGEQALLLEDRTGIDGFFKFLTSRPYPVEAESESMTLRSEVIEATFRNVFKFASAADAVSLSSGVVAGTFRAAVQAYEAAPQRVTLSSAVEAGTLRNTLKAYSNPPDPVSISSQVVAGTLLRKLITTVSGPEAVGLSSSVVGGTLV